MGPLFKTAEIDPLRRLLTSPATFSLLTHVNPDGDAIGSLLGFAAFLRALGHRVYTMVPNAYPDFLSFLGPSGDHRILIHKHQPKVCEQALKEADVIVCLDMNVLSRLEILGDLVAALSRPKVLIDHHPLPNSEQFTLIFSKTEVSSSCELVYRMICELDMLPSFPQAAVEPLYVGVMTDTNNFSNSVTAETFEAAAALMRLGVDKEKVQRCVFGTFSEQRMRLMAHAVFNRMILVKQYRTAYISLSLAEQEAYSFQPGDTEGFVNIPLNISDVDVSMLFVETPGFIRVSLRSRNGVDVNEMSGRFFNGGGHRLASGGRLYCSFAELPEVIMQALEGMFGKDKKSLA